MNRINYGNKETNMDELIKFPNLEQVLKEYGFAVQELYKQNLLNDDKKASGQLLDSVRYIYTQENNSFIISLNLAYYWRYVEYGRRPGKFPPPDKILEWIRIKPVLPRPMANGKLPTEQQLAYLIGRKIATKGIDAGNQLHNTVEEINEKYALKISEAINKDIEGMAIMIFNDFSNPKWN